MPQIRQIGKLTTGCEDGATSCNFYFSKVQKDQVEENWKQLIDEKARANDSIQSKEGPRKVCTISEIWTFVVDDIYNDKSLFTGFWKGVPARYQQVLLLSYVSESLEGSSLFPKFSRSEFDRIFFNPEYGFVHHQEVTGLISAKGIRSTILSKWIENFLCSSKKYDYSKFVKEMLKNMMDKNFNDADMLGNYLEWSKISPNFTLLQERIEHRSTVLNEVLQRIVGFVLIGFTLLGILRLLGLL